MAARRLGLSLTLGLAALLLPGAVVARTLYQSADRAWSLQMTGYVKTLALGLNHSLPGSTDTAQDFTRARLMLEGDLGAYIRWTVHYEHFGLINPAGETTTGLFAGSRSTSPQRFSLLPLDWTVKETASLLWRHELDRLSVQVSVPAADIVLGRQAISWGVGRLWTPSDLFVAFSPVEIDREFKPGVDAARLKVPLGTFSQLEMIYAAFDENFRSHAVGVRAQRTIGNFDTGLMLGKFFRDFVTGPFFDGEVNGIGVRGEFTVTHNSGGRKRGRRTFVRGVGSTDYRFASGVYAFLEYYFNGFGEEDPVDYPLLFNADRVTRGEVFNFGRHYLGGILQYEPHPLVRTDLFGLWNLLDQSFLVGPLVTVSLSDESDLRAGAYFPIGTGLVGSRVQSEFGLYPQVYYVEIRLYF